MEKIRKSYLKKLTDNLKIRFEDKSLLSTFDIFDPKKIPERQNTESSSISTSTKDQKDCDAFMTYSNDHIRNLSKQYQGDGVDVCGSLEECLEEWGCFRQYMLITIKS